MPIRNEADYIAQSLGSILAQDYPADRIEILIADGMSDDGTRTIIQRLCHDPNLQPATCNLQLLDNPGRIVPTAFNIALSRARGDVIIRVDGHCEIAPDYVRRCVELLEETGADNVGGLQRAVGEGPVAETIALATSSPFGVGGARFHYATEPGWADTVYLGAYRRDVFERIGGFDEELVRNQDDEFNFRLTQTGGKIWLDPSIRSRYYSRASLCKLWRQYYQYGFYKVRVIQKRGAVPSPRHLVPATFVLTLLGSWLAALITRRRWLALFVAGPYLVANLIASVLTARRASHPPSPVSRPPSPAFQLPLAFATLHLAYGLGFLAGLWHWRNRWGHAEP